MNNKILYGIIAVAFVGGMFTVAYAGPISQIAAEIDLPTITLAGNVDITGDLTCTNCIHDTEIATGAVGASEIAANAVRGSEIDGISKIEFGTCQFDPFSIAPGSVQTNLCGGSFDVNSRIVLTKNIGHSCLSVQKASI